MEDKAPYSSKEILRQKAEEILKSKQLIVDTLSLEGETLKLIHELDVHQIELEMQNEELTLAKEELEIVSEKYIDLYDFAPTGYFTLSRNGEIHKVNLKGANMLGKERSLLKNNRFAFFLTNESKMIFSSFLDRLFENNKKETCEITLSVNPQKPTYLLLNGVTINNSDYCFLTAVDISKLKKTEIALKKSELLLQASIDSQKDTLIFSFDKDYNYLSLNKAHSDVMKQAYNIDVKIGMNILECISSIEDRKAAKENYDRALSGESFSNIRIYGEFVKAYYESFFNPIIDSHNKTIGATGLARNITKRLQIEEAIKESEEKFRTLFDSNRDSITIFRLNAEGKAENFIEANPASSEIYGYTREELMNLNLRDLEPITQKIRKQRVQTLQTNGRLDFETIIKTKKGKFRNVEIESLIIQYLNEPAVMHITRDITERKQIEVNAKKAQENLVSILDAIPDLLFEVGHDGMIHHFHAHRENLLAAPPEVFMGKRFQDIMPAEVSAICMEAIDEANEKGWSNGKSYSLDLESGKYWFELAVSPINTSNPKDKHYIFLARDITTRKIAEIALKENEEKLLGIFNVANSGIIMIDTKGNFLLFNDWCCEILGYTRDEFSQLTSYDTTHPDDYELSKQFSDKLNEGKIDKYQIEKRYVRKDKSFFWGEISVSPIKDDNNNVIYVIGIITDITERKKTEELLSLSKTRFRSIIDSSPIGMAIINDKEDITYLNQSFVTMFGYTWHDIPTMQEWFSKAYPEAEYRQNILEKRTAEFERIKQNGSKFNPIEVNISCKDGTQKTVLISASFLPSMIENEYVMIFYDITARKIAETKQKDSLNLIQNITSRVPGVLYQYLLRPDGSSCFPYASEGIKEIYNVNPEDVREDGSKVFSSIHPDDLKSVSDSIQKSAKKMIPWKHEYRVRFDDGKIHFLSGNAIPQREKDGSVLWHGFITDVTEQKLAEQSLRESDEKIRNLLDTTDGIIWEADAKTFNFNFVSKQAERLLGFPVEEWYTDGFWKNHIHPDDRDQTIEYCISRIKLKESHDFTYRFITNNGKVVWLRDIVKVIVKDEKPLLLQGVMFDITNQKRIEESLRESEEKYRGLVENSPDAVVIYSDGKIVFVNEEGIRMVAARSKEEIIGRSVLQFIHPDSIASVIQRMEEVILDNNASPIVEEKFVDLDGNPFDVELKAIPTIFEQKEAVQVIIHDITKRKQSLLELNKMNRVYSLISQINNLILRSKNREELLYEICRIAVTYGKFRMCWIGMLDDASKTVNTEAFYGVEEGYFTRENKITIVNEPQGKGPTGTAIREGRTVICNNIATDSIMENWRDKAIERGYHSSIAIPIVVLNNTIGSFNLYSEETNSFSSKEEVELLEKITQNISFTLESILFEEERIKTQDKIKQLSQAVEQSPVTIVITNTKGEIEYVNPKFSETTGYSFDEVVGQNPRLLKSEHTSTEEYKELWQTLLDGNEWHGEFHNVRKDGESYWESASISPILNAQGKTTHYIAIKEDITTRKNVEKQLITAKEKAEESDRLKLAFLANMSHEIRTPMNGILGFTELLKEPKLTGEEQQEYIRIIEKSGIRMLNIINDIISISKVESGQVEIALSETNVNEQIHYINTFFKPEAKQKGIQLLIKKELNPKDTFIKTDKEKLYAILTNLVKNAIKFTDSGFIEFGCEKKGDNLEFFVKDTGLGITKSQKKIIFERFRQANETINRSHEGSGLGLAISKAYVEILGGKIWVKSEEGKGSTFYFSIPFHSDYKTKEKNAFEKTNEEIKEENKIKDLKVLIVEDDAISKLLVTIAVKPFSKEILKVSTGLEAIEACRNNPDIDLVMMDINMPEMGGYEATQKIREFNKKLVIIAQTANGMQSDRDYAIAAGCTDYISKPVNLASLSELIQKYFKS